MKKLLFTLLSIPIAMALNAQLYIGGTVDFSATGEDQTIENTTTKNYRNTNFSILPEAGYYLSEDLAIGGKIGLSMQRYNQDPGGDDDIRSLVKFHIAPYVRKYFSLGEQLYAFGQGGISLSTGKRKYTVADETYDGESVTDFSLTIKPGLEYKLTKQFSAQVYVGAIGYYLHREKEPDNPNQGFDETITHEKTFKFNVGLKHLQIGIKYYLNSSK